MNPSCDCPGNLLSLSRRFVAVFNPTIVLYGLSRAFLPGLLPRAFACPIISPIPSITPGSASTGHCYALLSTSYESLQTPLLQNWDSEGCRPETNLLHFCYDFVTAATIHSVPQITECTIPRLGHHRNHVACLAGDEDCNRDRVFGEVSFL
jgi:hypothetical protein